MVLSVNTNTGSMVALQNLNITNKALEKTQLAITTGLRVNGPKDDAATYAIAQNMRGDIGSFKAVKIALAAGESTVNVAISAGMPTATPIQRSNLPGRLFSRYQSTSAASGSGSTTDQEIATPMPISPAHPQLTGFTPVHIAGVVTPTMAKKEPHP